MSQTFLEDIPEFLEIQRNSFLRILDIGLIQAFDKINPIVPTSQCKYGLLFFPKDYVLILPENTITEAFLQGKTYGCKIYVPAVIYNIENSLSNRIGGRRFKSLKTLRVTKTTSSRFSEETLFGIQEGGYPLAVEMKRSKFEKGNLSRILSWECFLTMLLAIQSLSQKNKTLVGQGQLRSFFSGSRENKVLNFISKLRIFGCFTKDSSLNKTGVLIKPNLFKRILINLTNQDYPRSIEPYKQTLKPTLHYLLKKVVDKNTVLNLNLKTAQRTRKNYSQTKKNSLSEKKAVLYETLPKTIRQKSQLGFFQKKTIWYRGRSPESLIYETLNRLELQEAGDFLTLSDKKKYKKEWLLPFSKGSLINSKAIKVAGKNQIFNQEALLPLRNSFKNNLDSSLSLTSLAKPVSRKEWVCIGVLPLMTPRGHFIINGSHRIIISQMARAPGLYYQTGDKVQATIVPSKGAWLRLSVKASDNGEIKVWVRITPQRKMPYKIFIETYKHLEISKTALSKGLAQGSKFLNLAYKTLNSKIKHLDKHYAVGYVSGQINRTLLNPNSYSLGALGRKRLNERLGINDKKGYLTSKDISLIKDNLLKLLGQKSTDLSLDDIDHLENRRVRTCGELLQTEIETGMARLKKAIGKQLDEYSNPDSSLFNSFKGDALENSKKNHFTEIYDQNKTNNDVFLESLAISASKVSNHQNPSNVNTLETLKFNNFFWLKIQGKNWELYTANREQTLALFKQKKGENVKFWKKNQNLLFLNKKLTALTLHSSIEKNHYKIFYQPKKIGITLAQARLGTEFLRSFKKVLELDMRRSKPVTEHGEGLEVIKLVGSDKLFSDVRFTQEKPLFFNKKSNLLSPSKIIGTKAFAGALREFFGSNPLSQYMDQTNPLAEITHKRRLSSLGPGGVDRASAGIAIRGIHPSHYGRICPIETPEGKNAGLVNSMTMWARINNEGFLETPYFEVKGGSLMSHTNNLVPHWNFIPTKRESQGALKIVSSDLKITQSAFLPSIALPTRDGSERSFGREKRDYVDFCGISPMQNISVATSLIPFLEHDDATRALMGSNMQRQAVPLLKAKEPLIRTGLEGKVVGESGHALQASCSGIISRATRTSIAIDCFDIIKKGKDVSQAKDFSQSYNHHLLASTIKNNSSKSQKYQNMLANPLLSPLAFMDFISQRGTINMNCMKGLKFIGNIKKLSFLKQIGPENSDLESSFLAPRPISSLFYTINHSFKGFFKLIICWRLGLFKENKKNKDRFQVNRKVKEKPSKTTYYIPKTSFYHKPKTINCWRTFLYTLVSTTYEHKYKKNIKSLKNRQMLGMPNYSQRVMMLPLPHTYHSATRAKWSQPGSIHSTFFNQEKTVKQALVSDFDYLIKSNPNFLRTAKFMEKKEWLRTATTVKAAERSTVPKLFKGLHSKEYVKTKTFWRENSKIKRHRKIHDLQQYTRSNQATVCVQRPAVTEGRWVQKGDLIGDCSASKNGVLALGQNIVVAYLPMEGFNFEDAIVVSDRLVHEELYTSIHVQRVEFDMDALVKKHIPKKIKIKKQKNIKTSNQDWITFHNPHLLESEKQNLNPLGIIHVGSWVGPGDVLVSKVFPVERKIAPSRHLLAAVFQEKKTKILDTDDTSVRVPKGIHGRVINVKIVGSGKTATLPLIESFSTLSQKKNKQSSKKLYTFSNFSIYLQGVYGEASTRNNSIKSFSRLDCKHLPNVSADQNNNVIGKTTLVKQKQFFHVNKTVETAFSPLNNPLEPRTLQQISTFSKGNSDYFLHNKNQLPIALFPLDIEARKIRITKSLKKANAIFKQHFILDFGNSVFQVVPYKDLGTFSYNSNLIAKQPLVFIEAQQITNSKKIKERTLFLNLQAKEQATMIAIQGLSFKLINSYFSSTTSASPSLVRRVFFQELINQAYPLTKMLLSSHASKEPYYADTEQALHGFSGNKYFANVSATPKKNESYSQKDKYLNNSFSLGKTQNLNVKEILANNLFTSQENKEYRSNLVQSYGSLSQGEGLISTNLTQKKFPINEKLKRNLYWKKSINIQEYKITGVRIYIAERKKLQVGDKMSGRHGNKGIVSTILPREDMPYLPDGTPVDMVLNPLGIPSRMNVGQVFECLLGLAASVCGESIGHTPFDEMYGPEASRSLVYLFLYVSRLRSRADWLFQPNFPGKTLLFDGRTGSPFEQWVTVGRAYMLKLIHMVDEKIHARSIGPRSLVTQQPVKGRARGGGQRLGEMEIWALEGFGAAYILQEILTIKSDDIKGREDVESSIISATALSAHIPETFRITLFELRCLCLNLELNQNL